MSLGTCPRAAHWVAAILLLHAANGRLSAKAAISGTVLGYDGKPLAAAAVRLSISTPSHRSIAETYTDPDGRFSLSTEQTGLMLVQFAGVNHGPYTTVVVLEPSSNIPVSVRLASPTIDPNPIRPEVRSMNSVFTPKPLAKQTDGRFLAEFAVTDSPFVYRIDGMNRDHFPLSGTQAESYRLQWVPPGGGFLSVVTPSNGRVRIIFDPTKLPKAAVAARIDFPGNTRLVQMDALHRRLWERERERAVQENAQFGLYLNKGGRVRDFHFVTPAPEPADVAELERSIVAANDPIVRQLSWLAYLDLTVPAGNANPDQIERALRELPPTSPIWALRPGLSVRAIASAHNPEPYAEYPIQIAEHLSDRFARAEALGEIVRNAYAVHNRALLADALGKLAKEYADLAPAQRAIDRFGDAKFAVGDKIPVFSFPMLEHPEGSYTNNIVQGSKYLLIDFWATWCAPCVAEMPVLHQAYEKFHPKGFEILSCSIDDDGVRVETFRKQRFPMPWLNAQSPAISEQMFRLFGLYGVPSTLLVDSNGKIVATNEQLRGKGLLQQLSALFSGAEPTH